MATTIDDAFATLWHALDPKLQISLNPDAAIYKAWRAGAYRDWGSPIGNEHALEEGGVAQTFVGAIIKWSPETGAVEVVSD